MYTVQCLYKYSRKLKFLILFSFEIFVSASNQGSNAKMLVIEPRILGKIQILQKVIFIYIPRIRWWSPGIFITSGHGEYNLLSPFLTFEGDRLSSEHTRRGMGSVRQVWRETH